ncbi:MAG: hypothetical protein PUB20_06980, partial [Clostridia bacterium]|nr:hypothetical protein [Clostridia bacterium]
MKIKKFLSDKEMPICIFLLLSFLSVLYSDFDDIKPIFIKILFAISAAVFSSFFIKKVNEKSMAFPLGIFIVSAASINLIPQSEDLYLIAGAAFAILGFSFAMTEKLHWLSIIFMLAAVIFDPCESVIMLPALVAVLFMLKKKLTAVLNLVVSASVTATLSLLGNYGFSSDRFDFLRLSFGFLNTQKEVLVRFSIISLPVAVIAACLIYKLFRSKNFATAAVIISEFLFEIFIFLISKNSEIIFLFFLPFFAVIFSLSGKESIRKILTDF